MGWQERARHHDVTTIEFAPLQAFDGLTGDDGGPLVLELITLYLKTSREALAKLDAAFSKQDWHVVHHTAHGLKSTSRSIGAVAFADECERLEDFTDPKTPTQGFRAEDWWPRLTQDFQRVQRDLKVIAVLIQGLPVPAGW